MSLGNHIADNPVMTNGDRPRGIVHKFMAGIYRMRNLTSDIFEWGFMKQTPVGFESWFICKREGKKYRIRIEEIK
jgi:hypothetical protein